MSNSKKTKHSSPRMATEIPGDSIVFRAPQPYIAKAIKECPSLWVELPQPTAKPPFSVINGPDIQFPLLGKDYMATFSDDEAGHIFIVHFLVYLASLARVRLFRRQADSRIYLCTDASDDVVKSAASLTQQVVAQKLAPETLNNLLFFRDNEFWQ